jgi:hypothetical protein
MILIGRVRSLKVTALTGGPPLALMLALLLAGAAACGGGAGGAPAAAPKTSASAEPQGAFRQCLRQHGVTLPEQGRRAQGGGPPSGRPTGRPTGRPSDFPSLSPSRRQAVQACASLAPNGGRFGGVDQSALKAFQSCMSRHGVKITNSFRPGALRTATADPKAAAAFRTCRALLPQRQAAPTSPSPSAGPS